MTLVRVAAPEPNSPKISREENCRRTVAILESARERLFPTPTAAIDHSFLPYLDALLELYRECPEKPKRARRLHDRANVLGRRFESLVNRTIDEAD